MIKILSTITFLSIVIFSCASVDTSGIAFYSKHYKENRKYEHLEFIFNTLKVGMSKKKIEVLLGEADHSPIEGLYYYSSDKYEYSKLIDREQPVGAVLDYRKSGVLTDRLQEFTLGPIGE